MSRISSSLSGLDRTLQSSLNRAFADLQESGLRLATLQRVNRGSDDPAGLIAIGQIEAELVVLEQADENAARAESIVNVADSALGQVSSLANDIRGHVVAAAVDSLSDAERAAHQIEVDAALDAINRIGASTNLGGRNLLDGSASELTFVVSSEVGNTVSLDLPHVSTSKLGDSGGTLEDFRSGGKYSLASGNLQAAVASLSSASSHIAQARGRAGAFARYTLDASRNVNHAAQVNLSEAVSRIRDTDVAAETARHIQARIRGNAALASVILSGKSTSLLSRLLER
jgi:flagellin-like hook-associated protein FlgL